MKNVNKATVAAFFALGIVAAIGANAVGKAEGAKPLVNFKEASAFVSNMPEAKGLKELKVPQITVLCMQDKSADPFRIQYGYWDKHGPRSVHTDTPCNSWGQPAAMLPTADGWEVRTAEEWPVAKYVEIVKAVYKDVTSR